MDLFPLNRMLTEAGLEPLRADVCAQFAEYLSLLLRWNARINLTSIRDRDGILSRHFVESIACARLLPQGIESLLDFGSGGGFPGLPIALCRPEISVMLAESQGKKSAFLREAVRTLGVSTKVHSARANELSHSFDCVTLRAVDRMAEAVEAAVSLVAPGGWLAIMTTTSDFDGLRQSTGVSLVWKSMPLLPGSEAQVLALGRQEA